MEPEEKLELIKEALKDWRNGSLHETSCLIAIDGIVNGLGKITKEDIEWGKKSIKEMEER
jgi:hypothetical protein